MTIKQKSRLTNNLATGLLLIAVLAVVLLIVWYIAGFF